MSAGTEGGLPAVTCTGGRGRLWKAGGLPKPCSTMSSVSHRSVLVDTIAYHGSPPPFPIGLFSAVISDLVRTSQIRCLLCSPSGASQCTERNCLGPASCGSCVSHFSQHRPEIPDLWPQSLCTFCSLHCGVALSHKYLSRLMFCSNVFSQSGPADNLQTLPLLSCLFHC